MCLSLFGSACPPLGVGFQEMGKNGDVDEIYEFLDADSIF
jgi:hypothetical protein